jgi:polysaccharide deacetylase family protein (PEP-CTERM system associated)
MRILSFDIEEWFHILDHESTKTEDQWSRYESRIHPNTDRILSLLETRNQKATFFCLGWVARLYPEVIKAIDDAGHEIACHSDRHQLAYEQTPREFVEDLKRAVQSLENLTGKKIRAYRAPGFSLSTSNRWVFDELINAGIEIDCSIFPASRAHGGFPEFDQEVPTNVQCSGGVIKEFPINTFSVLGVRIIFTGGGYFRVLPYTLIKRFAKQSEYIMTYFHPRDFDNGQPMIPDLSFLRKFKSYYGLRSCEGKLARFLDDFQLMTLDEADKAVDWKTAPIVHI